MVSNIDKRGFELHQSIEEFENITHAASFEGWQDFERHQCLIGTLIEVVSDFHRKVG
jgi:hypothetical protein